LYHDPIIYNTKVKEYYESIVIADMIGEKPCKDCEDSNCRKCIAVNEAINKVPTICSPKYCMMIHAERGFKQKLARYLDAIFNKTRISDSKLLVLRDRLERVEQALLQITNALDSGLNELNMKQNDILAFLLAKYMVEEEIVEESAQDEN
jgi:hypothetical protein